MTDLVSREDDDGGRTYQLLIEDPAGGARVHVAYRDVPSPTVQNEIDPHADALDFVLAQLGVQEFGVYSNLWPGVSDVATHGFYTVSSARGMERFPVMIVEGTAERAFMEFFRNELLLTVVPLIVNQAPYASNYLMPTSLVLEVAFLLAEEEISPVLWNTPVPLNGAAVGHPSTYPRMSEEYTDFPILYLWQVRKGVGPEEVWQGWYVERSGGSGDEEGHAYNERRIEFGPAVRTLGETVHEAGLFLSERNDRWVRSDESYMEQRLTAGATSLGIDVPLVTVVSSDEREDENGSLALYPQYQRTGYALGVETPLGFVPILGTYTESQTDWFATGNAQDPVHVRTTSIGTFVLGEYEPLVGFRFIGEQWPMDVWVLFWAVMGGPGAHGVGNWEASFGVFVQGEYEPLVGVQYHDSFEEAHWDHQTMIKIGIFTLGEFHPVIGVTYDGVQPLLPELTPTRESWFMSSGLFVLGEYVPLVGVAYEPRVEGSGWEQQETYRIGVFPGDYSQFIPLVFLSYEGELSSLDWLMHVPSGLGSSGTGFDAAAGVTVLGDDEPVVGVQYRYDTPSDRGYHSMATAGVYVLGDFVPLAGVAYCSDSPGVVGVSPGARPTVMLGAFVGDEFVPLILVRVESETDVTIELIPHPVCT